MFTITVRNRNRKVIATRRFMSKGFAFDWFAAAYPYSAMLGITATIRKE